MSLFGLTIFELSTLVGLVITIVGLVHKGYKAFRNDISDPLLKALDELTESFKEFEKNATVEHAEFREALDNHENRITTLEKEI